MKIIDFEKKGNYVRFYLGKDDDNTYSGEGWDRCHYEDNAGPVDPTHVTGHADLILPCGWLVREPREANWGYMWGSSPWSKDDLKNGRQPCVIAVPPVYRDDWDSFAECVGGRHTERWYLNDGMEPGVILPDYLMPRRGGMTWEDIPAWSRKREEREPFPMKMIDWEKKGNVVRFYLGEDNDTEYWGDDWNDAPYEYNAGPVYREYIHGELTMVFPFDWDVLEPADCESGSSPWTKEDMKERLTPCLLAVPPDRQTDKESGYDSSFDAYVTASWNQKGQPVAAPKPGVYAFYFGDPMCSDQLVRFMPDT